MNDHTRDWYLVGSEAIAGPYTLGEAKYEITRGMAYTMSTPTLVRASTLSPEYRARASRGYHYRGQPNPPKFERCLEHVRAKGKGYNEYAVCRAALMPKKNWPTPDHLVHALQEERAAQRQLDHGDTEGWTFHVGKASAHRESIDPYRNAPRFPENRGKQYFYQCVRPGGQTTIESTTVPLKPHTVAYNRARKLYTHVVGPFQSRYEALKWR